jgi:hypothetical protein
LLAALVSGQGRRASRLSLSERLDVEPHSLKGIRPNSMRASLSAPAADRAAATAKNKRSSVQQHTRTSYDTLAPAIRRNAGAWQPWRWGFQPTGEWMSGNPRSHLTQPEQPTLGPALLRAGIATPSRARAARTLRVFCSDGDPLLHADPIHPAGRRRPCALMPATTSTWSKAHRGQRRIQQYWSKTNFIPANPRCPDSLPDWEGRILLSNLCPASSARP